MTLPDTPEGWIKLAAQASNALAVYGEGGPHGPCLGCRFASEPLRQNGEVAPWSEVANDPTEAYFTCSLPLRNGGTPEWGEWSPCTEQEWIAGLIELAKEDSDDDVTVAAKALGSPDAGAYNGAWKTVPTHGMVRAVEAVRTQIQTEHHGMPGCDHAVSIMDAHGIDTCSICGATQGEPA